MLYYDNSYPARAQQYTVYFPLLLSGAFVGTTTANIASIMIAQDTSVFGSATNTASNVTAGIFSVVLTSAEMDGSNVLVRIDNANSGSASFDFLINIPTCPGELSAIPSTTSSLITRMVGMFQYLFYKRTVTATAETLFKSDSSTTLGSNTIGDNGTTVTKGIIG